MKSNILIFILLIFFTNAYCQNGRISGSVISLDQKPIEFALVSAYPVSDSTDVKGDITTGNGNFIIENLKEEDYVLTVQMLGYADHSQQISVSRSLQVEPIELREESTTLDEIEITAEQSAIESHLGKKVLRIGKDLSSTGSNALEAIDNIPSVTTTPRGQIEIRGNSNVIVYINGKATRRDPATLKYIAAENLEKIEVITNPSAKYDAEGVGGIINLVYKKDKTSNVKVELISNISMLTNPFYLSPNGGINASLTKEKISFFVNLSSDYGKYTDYVDSRRNNFRDSLQYYENVTVQDGIGHVSNGLVGFSLEPDSTSSIGLEINYDRWDLKNSIQQTNTFDYRSAPDQMITLPVSKEELENELWVNLSYEKEFAKKKSLKTSFTIGGEDETNSSFSEDVEIGGLPISTQQFLKSSDEKESQRYYHVTVDYEAPFFNWGTIETGVKADFIRYDIFQDVELRSEDIKIPDNDFSMDMQKLGLYFIQKKQINKLEYALGLRLEQFSSEAFQKANQRTFTQDYSRLFPSAQFHYLISDHEQTIGVNYTRRINRPGFFDLNPYVSYADPLNLNTGNPALRPEIADLFELNYHKEWSTLNMDLTLYQRTTRDAIQSIASAIDGNRTLATSVNIGQERNRGIEAQVEYRPTKAIKSSSTFVFSQNRYEDNLNEISYNEQTTWSLRLKQQWKLKNNWKLELSEIYRAPSYQIQEKRHKQFYVNIGISKKFNNKRGSLSLSVRDVFNKRDYRYSLLTSDFEIEQRYKWQTRQITIGLRYTIIDNKN